SDCRLPRRRRRYSYPQACSSLVRPPIVDWRVFDRNPIDPIDGKPIDGQWTVQKKKLVTGRCDGESNPSLKDWVAPVGAPSQIGDHHERVENEVGWCAGRGGGIGRLRSGSGRVE